MALGAIPIMILIGFLLGAVSGYIMHRADFCISGMFRDLFLFRTLFKMRALILLVVSSMLMFEAARQAGLLAYYPFPLLGSPSLVNVAGGFLLGTGMVLAGGCVVGTLYKMGAGSATSMVAFAGLIAGSALYAEIHPWWSSLARKTSILPGMVTLPQLWKIDPLVPVLILTGLSATYFYRVYRKGEWSRPAYAEKTIQPWVAALTLSSIGTISYVAIGMPLGITTAYAKVGAWIESIVIPGHYRNLTYFTLLPLKYTDPLNGICLTGGPGPGFDGIALIQFPIIGGIIAGSAFSAMLLKELKIYLKLPLRQYLSAAVGGIIMGLASRMAPACNVWHLFGGLPVMAIQSILFLAGLVPGAWFGTVLLTRFVIR